MLFLDNNDIISQLKLSSKYNENSTFVERLYFGGNFGAAFSSNFTNIEVSPIVGYMITNELSAGVGVIYQYFKVDRRAANGTPYSLETNIYGGKLFGRYNFTQQLFAYSEFEALSLEVFQVSTESIVRDVVPSFFIGGGYFIPLGNRAGMTAIGLYNILYDPYTSPYNSPFVLRVGFTF
jgi:long-subunit fatty acid transport protein